jgi:hypothetical protein
VRAAHRVRPLVVRRRHRCADTRQSRRRSVRAARTP